MTLGDVLDGAFKLFKANAATVVAVTAVFVVPVQLLGAYLQRDAFGRGVSFFLTDPTSVPWLNDSPGWGGAVVSLLGLLLVPLAAGAVCRVAAASYLGREMSPGDAVRSIRFRPGSLIAAWIVVHLLEIVGFVLLLLPGLAVFAAMVAVAPAIVVEDIGPFAAVRRSATLVRPRLFPVMGIALLAGLLASVIGGALGFVPGLIAVLAGGDWGWLLAGAAGILSSLLTTPLAAIVATLVYFDARIRHEGLDLELMAAEIDRGAAAG